MWSSLQICPQVASLVRTQMTSSLSLSPSYHDDDLQSPEAVVPPHGHESTMDQELGMVPWSIYSIHGFFYKKQLREIPENSKIMGKPLIFLINAETPPTFFKLSLELYHNQFSI
jgi:hypothetical protein